MINENVPTAFASPGRYDLEEVKQQAFILLQSPQFKEFSDSLPDLFMILNQARQIVFANGRLEEFLNTDIEQMNGKRPGEAFNCIHAHKTTGGCGTTENCSVCGAANSILCAIDNKLTVKECRITRNDGTDSLDLRVWSSPYTVNNENYVVFAVQDIADEKRRIALERIFFHDILNTAGGLHGITELVKEDSSEINEFKDILFSLSETLINEIKAQKELLSAERNELQVSLEEIDVYNLIEEIVNTYRNHRISENKNIEIDNKSVRVSFFADRTLASRIVGNMLKNAIEATAKGETINVASFVSDKEVVVTVHNPSVMSREVQLQLFQRSFSTKGNGRGLGTYSMKLLMERYLKGKIWFKSEENYGTTFFAAFPNNYDQLRKKMD